MQPVSRLAFDYPLYALAALPNGSLAVSGGGGRMKSGIPNSCHLLSFDHSTAALSILAHVPLSDAAVAIAVDGPRLHLLLDSGLKTLLFTPLASDQTSPPAKQQHQQQQQQQQKQNKQQQQHNNPAIFRPQSAFHHDVRISASDEQTAVAVSPKASLLVAASDTGAVLVLRLPRFEPVARAQLHTQGVTDLALSPDGALAASTGRDRAAHVWRTDTVAVQHTLAPAAPRPMRTHVCAVRFAPDAATLFVAESNPRKGGWLSARAADTGTVRAVVKAAPADAITALAVDASGARVALSSAEGHVMLFAWNGAAFTQIWTSEPPRLALALRPPPPPHVLPVTGMVFSSSGTHLLSASADYTVAVWQTAPPPFWRIALLYLPLIAAVTVALLAVAAASRAVSASRAARPLPPVTTPSPLKPQILLNETAALRNDSALNATARPGRRRRRDPNRRRGKQPLSQNASSPNVTPDSNSTASEQNDAATALSGKNDSVEQQSPELEIDEDVEPSSDSIAEEKTSATEDVHRKAKAPDRTPALYRGPSTLGRQAEADSELDKSSQRERPSDDSANVGSPGVDVIEVDDQNAADAPATGDGAVETAEAIRTKPGRKPDATLPNPDAKETPITEPNRKFDDSYREIESAPVEKVSQEEPTEKAGRMTESTENQAAITEAIHPDLGVTPTSTGKIGPVPPPSLADNETEKLAQKPVKAVPTAMAKQTAAVAPEAPPAMSRGKPKATPAAKYRPRRGKRKDTPLPADETPGGSTATLDASSKTQGGKATTTESEQATSSADTKPTTTESKQNHTASRREPKTTATPARKVQQTGGSTRQRPTKPKQSPTPRQHKGRRTANPTPNLRRTDGTSPDAMVETPSSHTESLVNDVENTNIDVVSDRDKATSIHAAPDISTTKNVKGSEIDNNGDKKATFAEPQEASPSNPTNIDFDETVGPRTTSTPVTRETRDTLDEPPAASAQNEKATTSVSDMPPTSETPASVDEPVQLDVNDKTIDESINGNVRDKTPDGSVVQESADEGTSLHTAAAEPTVAKDQTADEANETKADVTSTSAAGEDELRDRDEPTAMHRPTAKHTVAKDESANDVDEVETDVTSTSATGNNERHDRDEPTAMYAPAAKPSVAKGESADDVDGAEGKVPRTSGTHEEETQTTDSSTPAPMDATDVTVSVDDSLEAARQTGAVIHTEVATNEKQGGSSALEKDTRDTPGTEAAAGDVDADSALNASAAAEMPTVEVRTPDGDSEHAANVGESPKRKSVSEGNDTDVSHRVRVAAREASVTVNPRSTPRPSAMAAADKERQKREAVIQEMSDKLDAEEDASLMKMHDVVQHARCPRHTFLQRKTENLFLNM